ncbi:hypothetical protein OROHE_021315 [Orobanche hederae]
MGSLPFSPCILIAALVSVLLFVFTTDASEISEKPFRFSILHDEQGYETAARSAGPTVEDLGSFAGYVTLSGNTTKRMFYYLVRSRMKDQKNAPLIVSLTGGPGISASMTMFYECGPFRLNNDSSLVLNEFGWDTVADLLIIDSPMGTGFSYPTNDDDIPSTTEEAVGDLYDFLKRFFRNQDYTDLVNNELYLTGEGYAGHFIPALATRILDGNKKNEFQMKLRGVSLGNPWLDGGRQFTSYPTYARQMKLISSAQYNKTMIDAFSGCQRQAKLACKGTKNKIDLAACAQVNIDCNDILWDFIIKPAGEKNYYDLRTNCTGVLCYYDFSIMEHFLNQASVKKALGVDPGATFVTWSAAVNNSMAGDVMRDFTTDIPALLERGIKFLVYAGNYDLISNSIGIWGIIKGMTWSGGQHSFSPARPLKVDGFKDAGRLRTSGPLTFVEVYNAGHMVPMDQPMVALEMIKRFIKGNPL